MFELCWHMKARNPLDSRRFPNHGISTSPKESHVEQRTYEEPGTPESSSAVAGPQELHSSI